MKEYTMYVCETCGYESKDYMDMKSHEASHLGLTVEEAETYRALKAHASHINYGPCLDAEETRRFNEAVKKLIAFEKEHGLRD